MQSGASLAPEGLRNQGNSVSFVVVFFPQFVIEQTSSTFSLSLPDQTKPKKGRVVIPLHPSLLPLPLHLSSSLISTREK
jgi:hypothetical protein